MEQFKWELLVYETVNRQWSLSFLCCYSKSPPAYVKSVWWICCVYRLLEQGTKLVPLSPVFLSAEGPTLANSNRSGYASQTHTSLSPLFLKFQSCYSLCTLCLLLHGNEREDRHLQAENCYL